MVKGYGYTFEFYDENLQEAEYKGRKVKLNKIMQGDKKKFKVYVKNDKGNVVVVHFGQGGDAKGGTMRIRKSNPKENHLEQDTIVIIQFQNTKDIGLVEHGKVKIKRIIEHSSLVKSSELYQNHWFIKKRIKKT